MARNEEKALTLFNKWHTFKKDFHASASNRRPLLASECQSLPDAEKWRRDIVKDLTKKVAMIQNASLGEHRIRELNDEINKHMRQKHYWEIRIRELGGGDYRHNRTQHYDIEGKELPGNPGYKYYGAAKDLPGVRELFAEAEESHEQNRKNRSRGELYRNITADYYGFRDDDDGILFVKEAAREKQLLEETISEFKRAKKRALDDVKRSGGVFGREQLAVLEAQQGDGNSDEEDLGLLKQFTGQQVDGEDSDAVHVVVPSQSDIQASVTEEKKRRLLEMYS